MKGCDGCGNEMEKGEQWEKKGQRAAFSQSPHIDQLFDLSEKSKLFPPNWNFWVHLTSSNFFGGKTCDAAKDRPKSFPPTAMFTCLLVYQVEYLLLLPGYFPNAFYPFLLPFKARMPSKQEPAVSPPPPRLSSPLTSSSCHRPLRSCPHCLRCYCPHRSQG